MYSATLHMRKGQVPFDSVCLVRASLSDGIAGYKSEMCVGDLANALSMTKSSISGHMH